MRFTRQLILAMALATLTGAATWKSTSTSPSSSPIVTSQKEPWYPLFEKNVSSTQALLIELNPKSYIIVFKKGLKPP